MPILPVRNKNYSNGLKTSSRDCKVFISKGIGWTIYPVRFNCFPEIAVIELISEQKHSKAIKVTKLKRPLMVHETEAHQAAHTPRPWSGVPHGFLFPQCGHA
jgi:hypothetical protein